jgi:hypothetical protein
MSEERFDAQDDPGFALDLAAASTRGDGIDTQAMVDALATRLEGALPQLTRVKRRRVGGLLSKRSEVERIEVELGDQRFELVLAGGPPRCARNKVVRGITLKRDEVPVEQWVRELVEEVAQTATLGEQARIALEGLVM